MSYAHDPSSTSSADLFLPPAALSGAGRYRITVGHMFLGTAFLLLFLAVVIPNSLPVPTAVVMGLAFLLALPGLRIGNGFRNLLAMYACTVIVTIAYLVVGGMHDAPLLAIAQVTAIYILSPLAWTVIAEALLRRLGAEKLIGWFVLLSLLCAVSVALFFYLYFSRGAAAVAFFFQGANINQNEGFSGATMHVYGSLIFLCGGFFSSPELIRRRLLRLTLLAALLICALTSGRSALILSVPMGWLLGMMLASRTTESPHRSPLIRIIRYGLPMVVATVAALALLQAYTKIDLSTVLNVVTDKLASGGGMARVQMGHSLFAGVLDNGGLGSGQGVGVPYVSDPIHPWRYELVWLATLYRVGILGTVIYALPFVLYILMALRLALIRRLPTRHKFMFCGLVCALLATNTNPYIEAFAFQWMYVVPLVALFIEYPECLRKAPE
ncbi:MULTISPECIES: hypothetical protein [Rhodanobacter]|uniref:O-antigen ligase domain-containing protein n=1 Tax=Rhodanobacter hydrolyticus TaxID=2250595 RepID=A0ABW8J5F2_9GAMM|nr:hypothetical protein [Rhodanobacter sp. 7MK24]MBD8880676.1 hypothetical protein [Rhodanobacter sp. 7MK24]